MRQLRITRWYWKLLYVGVSLIIIYLVGAIGDSTHAGDGLRGILRAVAVFALTLIGARLFRGRDEDVAPPRPWWRMTGRWLAGFLIAVPWLVITIGSIGVGLGAAGKLANADTASAGAALGLAAGILFLLYLDSSIRLLLLRRQAGGPVTQD